MDFLRFASGLAADLVRGHAKLVRLARREQLFVVRAS
jgi:hypothetical protein